MRRPVSLATVNSNGLARGASVGGPVAIRATVGAVTGSAQLTVNSSPITVNWSSAAATAPVAVTSCLGQSVVFQLFVFFNFLFHYRRRSNTWSCRLPNQTSPLVSFAEQLQGR